MIITAATLRNIVRYDTDIQSLKRIKEQMKKLRKESIGTVGSISPASANKAVASAKAVASQQVAAARKIYGQASKVKSGFGTGMVGTQSTKDWAAVTAAQMKQMNSVGKTQSEATRQAKEAAQADKKRLQLKKQAAETTKREINSAMKLRDVAFSISRMEQLSIGQRYKAIAQAKQLASEYRRGNLDLRELNQQMKFLTANTRKAEAQARRLKRETTKTKAAEGRKGGGALLGVGLGGMAAAGAVGGAYAAYSGASGSVDRAKQINKLGKAGVDSYEAQALQRLVQTKGIDANLENVFQDLQEKLGELVSQSTYDQRSGKLKGGGELVDVANDLFLPLGYSLKDIAKMSSSEFIVQMKLNAKALNKSAESQRYYEETINDLSRISGLYADNGKEIIDTIGQMMDSGQMLNEEQLASLTRLREWGIAVSNSAQTLSDRFSVALSSAMGGADGLAEAMRQLTPLVEALGKAVAHIIKLTGFSVDQLTEPKTQKELFQSVKEPDKRLNSNSNLIMGLSAWELLKNQFKDSKPAMVPTPQAMLSPTPYQPSSQYSAPKQTINVMPAPVQLNIDGNKLEGVFNLISENNINSYNDRQMNDLMTSYPAR
ncbi:hypothetical protein [Yersinia proxima]|uniref:hypothetical protein n=1 Tax=Yersinia proxima TaxID=2890316 RepID=UPI001D1109AE|nr:hypothetical protein [Yersinia proxima]